jgi:ribonuclease R
VGGKRRGAKARPHGQILGRLSMTRHGYGFVEAAEGDFFIPAKDIGGAMHGDLVAVRPETHRGRQGRAGAVAKVIERANTTLVGRFDRHGTIGIVSPVDRRIRHDVFVAPNGIGEAESGDVVVVRLTAYPSRTNSAQGFVEEIVGREGDPGIQIEIIIREHGLRTEFPSSVAEEAAAIRLDVE